MNNNTSQVNTAKVKHRQMHFPEVVLFMPDSDISKYKSHT